MSFLRLQHVRTDGETDVYHLSAGRRYHIGRGSDCEIRLLDLKLSRQHAVVEFTKGQWVIADCASHHGSLLEGKSIEQPVALAAGQSWTAGNSQIDVLGVFVHLDGDERADDLSGEDDQPRFEARQWPSDPENDEDPQPVTMAVAETDPLSLRVRQDDSEKVAAKEAEAAQELLAEEAAPVARTVAGVPEEDNSNATVVASEQPSEVSVATEASTGEAAEQRRLFIELLGERIGPLTRSEARDLKRKEITGQLTSEELAPYRERQA